MAGKFPHRGDFVISSDLISDSEWLSDSIIDDLGSNCQLIFPPKDSECPNCLYSPETGRSSDIYKTGGPAPFPDFTTCVYCGGAGRLTQESTSTVKLRVYWNPRDWISTGSFVTGDGYGQIIGYMSEVANVRRAKEIIIHSDIKDIQEIRCQLAGEISPFGFRKNRYFVGYIRRV